jgi:hypothetical protein
MPWTLFLPPMLLRRINITHALREDFDTTISSHKQILDSMTARAQPPYVYAVADESEQVLGHVVISHLHTGAAMAWVPLEPGGEFMIQSGGSDVEKVKCLLCHVAGVKVCSVCNHGVVGDDLGRCRDCALVHKNTCGKCAQDMSPGNICQECTMSSVPQCAVYCSICGEVDDGACAALPCRHTFHVQCIGTWFSSRHQMSCPLCRRIWTNSSIK